MFCGLKILLVSAIYYISGVNSFYNKPYVIPFSWDKDSKILPLCVEMNNNTVNKDLIKTAVGNVNKYLYSNNLETTSLLLNDYNYTNYKCPDDVLKIHLEKKNFTEFGPGYCTRKFKDGSLKDPNIRYLGCDITINICGLQTNAAFYNVLLHELLHVIGLDHPEINDDSVMSYKVQSKDTSYNYLKNVDNYITLKLRDIDDLHYIIRRDFPNSIIPNPYYFNEDLPDYPPLGHISNTDNYLVDEYSNLEKCWINKQYNFTNAPSSTFDYPEITLNTNAPSTKVEYPETISNKIKGKNRKKRKNKYFEIFINISEDNISIKHNIKSENLIINVCSNKTIILDN